MEATKRALQDEFCGLVLTYRVNDTLLCVPVEHVDSVIEPPELTEIPNAPSYVMGAFMHRGKTALALSLKNLLRLPATEVHTKKESLLVVWMGDQPIGYWVDEIKGMTDSGRGHWSAVPALIRDQGITRALVCDGSVFFPLDLTQSSQFQEIFRTLETFEKHRVHEVTEEDVQRAQAQPVTEETTQALLEPEETAVEDDYEVASFPADESLEEGYEEQIQTTAFAEHEPEAAPTENKIDTSILAQQMYEAQFKPAEEQHEEIVPELEFDDNGQADAFLEELREGSLSTLEEIPEVVNDASNEADIDESQIDAFDPAYLEQLKQEQPELLFDENGQADVFLEQLADFDEIVQTTEVDAEEVESIVTETDASQLDAFDPYYQEMLEQEALQESEQTESIDEQVEVDLSFTEEPYALLPTSLPEEDEIIEHELDYEKIFTDNEEPVSEQDIVEEAIPFDIDLDDELSIDQELQDGAVADEQTDVDDVIPLTEEPYSFLPTSLPEDDDAFESSTQDDEETQPLALLPHKEPDTPIDEPVADENTSFALPDMAETIARADYYADKLVESDALAEAKTEAPSLRVDQSSGYISDIPDELVVEEDEPETKARAPLAPVMPGGIIIRPDGQINKSFGLIKVFTIVLATSAAGSWWFRDELFHKEQIRKEIPSILQNEIAYLYSERVKIVNPPRGKTRMTVETPDEEITVIKRKYVDRDLLRERRKKGVKLHRVRRGDTLWGIAKKYLADPYRYPELAENNRIHNPNLIRPGDVVKITVKVTEKK